ncbi:MAG: primosomal protein N' [Vicinamibacterales bacterium]
MSDHFVTVAIPVPLAVGLTYRVPPALKVAPGVRVVVPLGTRRATGVVVTIGSTVSSSNHVRDIVDVLDDEPFFPADILELAQWIAEYYLCGPGEALASASPPFTWVTNRVLLRLDDERAAAHLAAAKRSRPLCGTDDDAAVPSLFERAQRGSQEPASAAAVRAEIDVAIIETLRATGAQPISALAKRASARLPHAEGREGRAIVDRAVRRLVRAGVIELEPVRPERAERFRWQRAARLNVEVGDAARLTARQREVVEFLRARGGGASAREWRAAGMSGAVLARLAGLGVVTMTEERDDRDPFADGAWHGVDSAGAGPAVVGELTAEQRDAMTTLEALARSGQFQTAVLHGVTGSGKTEVYLRMAKAVQESGRTVLVLVPEIALTPAVAVRFRRLFGDRVAVQHSGLSDGERHDQWHRIRRGEIDVVVGTRSAVFAPLRAVGLIVVDEEHDTSYKQEETPRYHARDVALVRAQRAGALVILGSATPSLESYQNAVTGRYRLVELRRRVQDRPMASVHVVDMRAEYAERGPDVVLSSALAAALRARMAAGEQAVVLLNRRGFATTILCRRCGETVECPQCSVALTVHKGARRARCHYCDHAVPLPEACPSCGGLVIEYEGIGTERVEAELSALLPDARIARVDRDTIQKRGAIATILARFAARTIDVLVGTQMIAKGHDFPQVTLVGVISADVGLGMADFRASERTFQLLTQVAGRAGRGDQPGEALIQTLHPDHYSIGLARTQNYLAFFEREVEYRRRLQYPPLVSLVNVIVRGSTEREAAAGAARVARAMRPLPPGVALLGPAPAPLAKLRGQHRFQLFLKLGQRRATKGLVERVFSQHPDLRKSVTVDVDPVGVL